MKYGVAVLMSVALTVTVPAAADAAGTAGGEGTGAGVTGSGLPRTPRLEGLPENTAVDLGRYRCAGRMPQIAIGCHGITDFSRFNYDPYGHRMLMFGGGHATTTTISCITLPRDRWS